VSGKVYDFVAGSTQTVAAADLPDLIRTGLFSRR